MKVWKRTKDEQKVVIFKYFDEVCERDKTQYDYLFLRTKPKGMYMRRRSIYDY